MDREIRAAAEVRVDGRIVEGYAAVFNIDTDISGAFRERIASDAFPSDLTGVPLLWDHDTGSLLARAPKTLALKSDKRGLHFRAELPDTTLGRDLAVLLDRGDLTGASFAFTVAEDNWDDDLRTIARIDRLYDVSLVTTPAYPDATVALRHRPTVPSSPAWAQDLRLWLVQHPSPKKGSFE